MWIEMDTHASKQALREKSDNYTDYCKYWNVHVIDQQAALPQGIVPFVFAKEYNCHPQILSTA
jgi:hypothetical protein